MVNPILRQIKLSLHEELENLLFTDKARFKDSLKKLWYSNPAVWKIYRNMLHQKMNERHSP